MREISTTRRRAADGRGLGALGGVLLGDAEEFGAPSKVDVDRQRVIALPFLLMVSSSS